MSLTRMDPWQEMRSMRRTMDRLLEDFGRPAEGWAEEAGGRRLRLPLDVYTTPSDIVIVASLPGLTANEVEIIIEGDSLTIQAELRPPLANVEYLFRERAYGPIARTLTLNVPVDADHAEANFENGVLTVTLPKAVEARPKMITVKGL